MRSENKEFILALDIGTSSVRAALYDHAGRVLPKTMVKNERLLKATDDGGSEIDAEVAFRQVVAAIDNVLAKAGKLNGEITHVATSCFWHSLVGIDADGRPTTKVLSWADTRSRDCVALLRKRFDEEALHNRTGARFHSSFWPAKLLWLRREFPELWAKTTHWLGLSELIALRLFGGAATGVSMASGTGVFDIRKCNWDSQLLRYLKVNAGSLARIAGDGETFRLTSKFTKRWPRLKEAQWFSAIGDGAANNVGAGCVSRVRAALMIGTSGAMRVAYEGDPPAAIPSGLWCYRVDRRRVILGGALSNGGGLYRWLKDNLRLLAKDDKTEAKIAKRPPAGHGLVFLPFLAGERGTGYHESAAGAILGLRTVTDSIDIMQAALEAVAYRFAEIFEQLDGVCGIREIVASGGALRASPVWTQIIADVLERGLDLPDVREASSHGAVLLALETTGKIRNIGDIPDARGTSFQPDKTRFSAYRNARKRHLELYKKLILDR